MVYQEVEMVSKVKSTLKESAPPDFMTAMIRTAAPYFSAFIVAKLAQNGVNADMDKVNAAVVFGGGTAWYAAVRMLEHRWSWMGRLLGAPRKPVYESKGA
jgi:hypothetical protein